MGLHCLLTTVWSKSYALYNITLFSLFCRMDLEDERQAEVLHRQEYEQSLRVMENFDPGDYMIDDEADYHDYLIDDDDYYDPNGEPC